MDLTSSTLSSGPTSPKTVNQCGSANQKQQSTRLGHGRDPHSVQVPQVAAGPNELHIQNIARLGREPTDRGNCVAIVQVGRAGLLNVQARGGNQSAVRVVAVNGV